MIGLYANDVLCRVALGRDFSGGGEYDRHGFQKMLDDYQALLGGFSLGDYFPSMEFVHSLTGMKSKLRYTFRRFDQFFDEVITEHRNSKGKQEEKKDLVDILLDIQKDGSSEIPLTMDNIKAVILDIFDWKLPPGLEAMDVDNTEAFGISMHRTVPLHVVAKPHFD
ncbi:hypothetical protein OIU78_016781 [Salix suchowensis]|nr:hypothetical protein OIU78_016781 [Salix suchowensis]